MSYNFSTPVSQESTGLTNRFESPMGSLDGFFSQPKVHYNPGQDHQVEVFLNDSSSPSKFLSHRMKSDIGGISEDLESLRRKLREESARKKVVLDHLEKQKRELENAKSRSEALEMKILQLIQSKDLLKQQKANSERQVKELSSKWAMASSKLERIREAVALAQQKLSNAELEKHQFEQSISDLQLEMEEYHLLKSKYTQMESKFLQMNEKVGNLEIELEAANVKLQSNSDEAQSQLYFLANSVSQLKEEILEETHQVKTKQEEIEKLNLEKSVLISKLDAASTQQLSSESKYNQLEVSYNTIRDELSRLTEVKNEMERMNQIQLADISSQLKESEAKLVSFDSIKHEMTAYQQELELKLESLKQEKEQIQANANSVLTSKEFQESEKNQLKTKIDVLELDIQFLQGDLNEKKAELDEMKRVNAELTSDLESSSAELSSSKAAQAQLSNSLQTAMAKISSLEQSMLEARNSAESESSAHLLEISMAHQQASIAQQAAKEDLEAVKIELKAETAKFDAIKSKLDETTAAHQSLLSDHELLQRQLDSTSQELSKSIQSGSSLSQRNKELENDVFKCSQTLANIEAELLNSQIIVNSQKNQLIAADIEVKGLKVQSEEAALTIRRMETDLELKTELILQLKTQKSQVSSQLEAVSLELNSTQSQLKEVKEGFDDLKQKNSSLESLKNNLQESSLSNLQQVESLKCQIDSILLESQTSKTELENQLSQLSQNLATIEAEFSNSQATVISQKEQLDAADMEMKGLKAQADEAEGKLRKFVSDLELKKEEILQLQAHKSLVSSQLENVSSEFSATQFQLKEAKEECDQLKQLNSNLESVNTNLKNSLETTTRTNLEQVETLRAQLNSTIHESQASKLESESMFNLAKTEYESQLLNMKRENEVNVIKISQQMESHKQEMEENHQQELKKIIAETIDLVTRDLTIQHESNLEQSKIEERENVTKLMKEEFQQKLEELESSRKSEIENLARDLCVKHKSELDQLQVDTEESTRKTLISIHESDISKLKSDHQNEVNEIKTSLVQQLDSMQSAHYTQVISFHQSIEELTQALSSSEKDKNQRVLELQQKIDELTNLNHDLAHQLSQSKESAGDYFTEKNLAQATIQVLRTTVTQFENQMAETDSLCQDLQSENSKLKSQIESLKSHHDTTLDHAMKDKNQWISLAGSQKKELEESLELLASSQEECEQLQKELHEIQTRKEEEEKESNDLRVKKLTHEVRMLKAELEQQKTKVSTRDTAIAAGRAREEKLQGSLDQQIEKTREMQRQLAERTRENILERGRVRSHSKSDSSTSISSSSSNSASTGGNGNNRTNGVSVSEQKATLEKIHDLETQLSESNEEIIKLRKQLEVEKKQVEDLISDQTKLTGHNNPKQKIQFTHRLMKENHELKLEKVKLQAIVDKTKVTSPRRRSLSKPSESYLLSSSAGGGNIGTKPAVSLWMNTIQESFSTNTILDPSSSSSLFHNPPKQNTILATAKTAATTTGSVENGENINQ